jgi:hypothetical protein
MADPLEPIHVRAEARDEQLSFRELREKYRRENRANLRAREGLTGAPTTIQTGKGGTIEIASIETGARSWNGGVPISADEIDALQSVVHRDPSMVPSIDTLAKHDPFPLVVPVTDSGLQSEIRDLGRDAKLVAQSEQVRFPDAEKDSNLTACAASRYHNAYSIPDLSDERQIFAAIDQAIADSDAGSAPSTSSAASSPEASASGNVGTAPASAATSDSGDDISQAVTAPSTTADAE